MARNSNGTGTAPQERLMPLPQRPFTCITGELLRILVADDHEAVRTGVCTILQSRGDVEICGQAANGREAVQKAGELNPDLVLLDITMPVLDGLSAAREIRNLVPRVVILFLSMHEGEHMANLAKSSGASGYVSKSAGSDTLLKAVDIVTAHGTFFPIESEKRE